MTQSPTLTIGPAGAVRLPDGRSITFFSAGPEDGFPVLYCHGAIGSPRWRTPELDRVIERLGIRYLVVNRPGFAGSDPSPGRTVLDFARDVGTVMSRLGYRRFSVVGVSAGAPYALACGWALAERLVALAAVSPLGPPDGRGAIRGLRYRVPLVPFGSGPAGSMLGHTCLRALGLKGDTPTAAMIDDYLVCRRPWGFDPADMDVPVTLWHGGSDWLVPLAHARALAAVIPQCTARVAPAGGHFFYSRWLGEIVSSLVPFENLASWSTDAQACDEAADNQA
ncbi:MAG TPA: alpha/beta fold hydrolase [Solirubrobacteraceae bacterium]|nr:alpha/beta fold hydrolase [Solirubrobacteraceae bacterium]